MKISMIIYLTTRKQKKHRKLPLKIIIAFFSLKKKVIQRPFLISNLRNPSKITKLNLNQSLKSKKSVMKRLETAVLSPLMTS
jgi:hypothetical protein